MVEMPVIPGTEEFIQNLLLQLDAIGIDGINLLEFCYPLCNTEEFKRRGFKLKFPPYEIYYNYWYAGGLAIAQSEELCLSLLLFALEKKLRLGVHYCSLENKFTGQIYQQNSYRPADATLLFSQRDYFFKAAKVFGHDIAQVKLELTKYASTYSQNKQYQYLQFNPNDITKLSALDVEICVASYAAEYDPESNHPLLKEIRVEKTTPTDFSINDI